MAILLMPSLELLGQGAPGDPDPTFGVGGKVITDLGANDLASALVLQPDGKLVALGVSSTTDEAFDFILARYLPDGSLDSAFGVGGTVTTDVGAQDSPRALILQPDGKLVMAGGADCDFALVRYLTNGGLDPTFGVGGKVITDFGFCEGAGALALQLDGKLVAAGLPGFSLARYLPNGSLDSTFGVEGKVTTVVSADGVNGLVLQPDGKLVASGGFGNFELARYLPDGSLDPAFGVGGKVSTDFGGFETAGPVVLQPDGKLVAAGGAGPGGGTVDFALARYLPNGSLDPTFGVEGKMTTDFSGVEGTDGAGALIRQPDGKLVAAGRACPDFACDFALARYLSDGSLDSTFGAGGRVVTDFGGNDGAGTLVLQPDGKLVAAGAAGPGGIADFALARYLSPPLVNAFVTFDPIPSSFSFTSNATGCTSGFTGRFRFEARMSNHSSSSLSDLVVAVTTLTNGNLLQNADGGPAGVGARLTVPPEDGFADGLLSPGEFVDLGFPICLRERRAFDFFVDVFGVVDGGAAAQVEQGVPRD